MPARRRSRGAALTRTAETGTEPRSDSSNPNLALAIVLSASFVQLVDVSIVNVAIPSIQSELSAPNSAIQLIVAGYALAFACILITAARLGDIYGRKRLFVTGMIGFTVASALCGAAPNAYVLVGARLLQGLMSGLMYPQVLSVIQVEFPPERRGKAFSVYGAVIGIATIIGPLLGGSLIAWNLFGLGWRTVFFVNVPIGLLAAPAAVRWLRESRAPDAPRLDIPGALLATLGLLLIIYPISVGQDRGWPWWTWALLAAAVPVFAVFVVYQRRKTRADDSPLVQMTLFRDRSFVVGILLVLVFFSGVAPFFFTTTLYLQVGFGFTPFEAGLTTFPFAVGSGVASALSDRLVRRFGKWVLSAGTLILVLGMLAAMVVVDLAGTRVSIAELAPVFLFAGVGLGLFIAPVTNLVLSHVRAEDTGSASGVLTTVQRVAAAAGLAVAGSMLFALVSANADLAAAAVSPQLRNRLGDTTLEQPVREEIVAGFTDCFTARASASDPSMSPPACEDLRQRVQGLDLGSAARQQLGATVERLSSRDALRRDYALSYRETLAYQVTVFSIAFLLVFALPGGTRHSDG
ncbi:MAG: MFS transporter [Egibacteraceae bacterium]